MNVTALERLNIGDKPAIYTSAYCLCLEEPVATYSNWAVNGIGPWGYPTSVRLV